MPSQKLDLEELLLTKYKGDIAQITAVLEKLSQKKPKKPVPEYGDVVISIRDLCKKYKVGKQQVQALKDINMEVRQGEYIALTGASGSGKSTLLQAIGALDKPSSGTIQIDGKELSKLSDRRLSIFRNQTIGFVFQFFYLQPFLSLARNLEVPGMFARSPRKLRKTKLTGLADSVGLSDRLRHMPNELSGGQMQRAAIARALLNSPKILLADEPTGNLDRENAFAIMELFDQVRTEFGTTIIVVTHDAELASRADREVRLQDGVIL